MCKEFEKGLIALQTFVLSYPHKPDLNHCNFPMSQQLLYALLSQNQALYIEDNDVDLQGFRVLEHKSYILCMSKWFLYLI